MAGRAGARCRVATSHCTHRPMYYNNMDMYMFMDMDMDMDMDM